MYISQCKTTMFSYSVPWGRMGSPAGSPCGIGIRGPIRSPLGGSPRGIEVTQVCTF